MAGKLSYSAPLFMLIRKVQPGERIPAWYGLAWFDWVNDDAVVVPLPLVLPILLGRHFWAALRTCNRDIARDPRSAFLDGVEHGLKLASTLPPGTSTAVAASGRCRLVTRP